MYHNTKIQNIVIIVLIVLSIIGSREAALGKSTEPVNQTFVTYRYIDPMSGKEAFHMLLPKGWLSEGSITWSANPALPAQSRFRFYNPNGSEEFNLFPTQAFFWTNNRTFLATNPPGSLRFGSRVAKPVDLQTAFTKVIIPGARKNIKNIEILSKKEVPELAKLAAGAQVKGVQSEAQGGKMRVAYHENGKKMEEEVYATVSQFIIQLPGSAYSGGYFINYWYVDYVFSFRDEMGKLDYRAKTFQTMLYSLKVNPQWYAKVVNVKEMLAQKNIQQIKAIGRIGDMVARAGSNLREDQQREWEKRQQSQDRLNRNFSDNIRGVDRFNDPRAGKEVELPSGYGNAWANNLGEYVVTESPSYNPNIGSGQHWELLTPVK
jgi:hypothetical protein